jgi:Xaa-Pro aminopeptidase
MSDDPYPLFSAEERARRRAALDAVVAEHDAAALVVYGERGSTAVPWATGWHVTREAAALVVPGAPVHLLVQLYNHVPNARRMAPDADVSWAGSSTFGGVAAELRRRTGPGARVAWIGPLPLRAHERLTGAGLDVVDVSPAYERLRMVKSPEELEWMRVGTGMTDRSLDALLAAAVPGADEAVLSAAVESAYVADGGTNHIHFFATTAMDDPSVCVPSQWPSRRQLRPGDVVVTELSASYWGYPGQLLRTITVAAEPTPLYRELHHVADAAFKAVAGRVRDGVHVAELVEAADLIDDAGFGLYDDLLHGFGGGYLPPVLRTRAAAVEEVPDMRLEAGMTIVVQPNVITRDERAGVQTGELLLVTETGYEHLHGAPRGLLGPT